MGFNEELTAAVQHHTGLHYVPSFNDFVSGAADDVEANELDRELGRDQELRPVASAPAAIPATRKTEVQSTGTVGADVRKTGGAEELQKVTPSGGVRGANRNGDANGISEEEIEEIIALSA